MKVKIIFSFIFVLIVNYANAQNYFGLVNDSGHNMSAGIYANPNLNINVDHLVSIQPKDKTFQKYGFLAQVDLPIFSQKGFDFDFRLGAGILFSFADEFKSLTGLTWNFSRTEDLNGRYFHSGFQIDVLPGYYGKNWLFAPHLSMYYQPWINIKHSEYTISAFRDLYPSNNGEYNFPRNGWFYQNYVSFQTGIGVGYFQSKWNVNLRAGFQHQPNRLGIVALPDIGILPFYGGVNFNYSILDK